MIGMRFNLPERIAQMEIVRVWVVIFLWALFLAAVYVYVRDARALFIFLREKHSALWAALDAPEIPPGTGNAALEKTGVSLTKRKFLSFLLNRRYLETADKELTEKCQIVRRGLVFLLAVSGVIAIFVIPDMILDVVMHPLPIFR
jgi:hypothetical protein